MMRSASAAIGSPVLVAFCASHTLCHVGGNFAITALEKVLHQYRKMIAHQGQARLQFLEDFNMRPLTAGGVRWWVKYEQMAQIAAVGLEKLHEGVVKRCVQNR